MREGQTTNVAAPRGKLRVVTFDQPQRLDLAFSRDQADKVRRQVEDAVRQGAVIRAQALPPAGASDLFLPLTVLTNVSDSMDVVRHETFGPVLCVMPVASMEEAVTRANDCELALTASVWSKDKRSADEVARLADPPATR